MKRQSGRGEGDWSPDGKLIIYTDRIVPRRNSELWILSQSKDAKPQPFLRAAISTDYDGDR